VPVRDLALNRDPDAEDLVPLAVPAGNGLQIAGQAGGPLRFGSVREVLPNVIDRRHQIVTSG